MIGGTDSMTHERKSRQVVAEPDQVSVNGHGTAQERAEVEVEPLVVAEPAAADPRTIPRKKLFLESDEDLDDEVAVLASCSVKRPPTQIVFRVRPGKQWRAEALIVDFREDDVRIARGKYLIVGDMRAK